MEVCQDVMDFVGLALALELLAALPPVLCVLCTITEKNSNVFSGFIGILCVSLRLASPLELVKPMRVHYKSPLITTPPGSCNVPS